MFTCKYRLHMNPMSFSDKYPQTAFIKMKRLNIPLDQIFAMVHENKRNEYRGSQAINMKSTKSKTIRDPSVTDGDEDYDSADDILDPKTEIELVNIKSDETIISDYEAGHEAQTIHEIIEDAVNLRDDENEEFHSNSSINIRDNMIDCMRSQFQAKASSENPSKHKCLMPGTSEITIASEYCTVERPCVMSLDKMTLHYVIHYIKRGVWDKVVPEPVEADKPRIDGYQCNICEKKFRNNHSKEEYSARGSFICHFATEHGKVIDAMRNDEVVDMKPVIELLEKNDNRLSKFVTNGCETAQDDDPVKVVESITWRIQQNRVNTHAQTSQKEKKNTKKVIKCPKCKDFDKNKDSNNLKLHIFHHYLDFWEDKVAKMTKNDTVCDKCSPLKRIVGANPEGCRTALICHRAIQHEELRTVLENDKELPEGFIEELFGEVSVKPLKVMHAGKSDNKPDEESDKSEKEM
eukprot:GFUD01025575.1.p1 GENE.GFUD01025575.1~~GFUD01025575.1.p1  ORF type:complete len:463 (+),score=121.88 GFUD01025575.1:105-1493(+)